MAVYTVKSANSRGNRRNLIVTNAHGKESDLELHRFALVGPGDQLSIERFGSEDAVNLADGGRRLNVVVAPHFEAHRELRLGTEKLKLLVTEINSDADIAEFHRLEQFHYKGIDLALAEGDTPLSAKGTGGRRAVLLASILKHGLSRAIGYIELQMPLLMCKPRHEVFAHPFNNEAESVQWTTWLGDGQKHVNLIARIARVVVDPEFRGIGASTLLVQAAKEFCQAHWHISGRKPLFLEISAEMLRYVDFVSNAGFHYLGDTEGNLTRITKDLRSIEKGAGGKSGIMSLQRKYHAAFVAYCDKTGKSFDEARIILSDLLQTQDPRSEMASDEWLAFRPIIRFPIPYFVIGLDTYSDSYVKEAISTHCCKTGRSMHVLLPSSDKSTDSKLIEYKDIEVSIDYEIQLTQFVRLIMDSFGIEKRRIRSKVVGPCSITAATGEVILITGSSGAGKSLLLNALSDEPMVSGLVRKRSSTSSREKASMLMPLPEGVPVFQYFAENYGTDRAFSALCQVGLSEAMIFIKPFEVLSMGQRYRAMFAELILSDSSVWLIDEFCSNLDPITSKILSVRLRKLALRSSRLIIVAAANTEHFIEALAPDQILVVRSGASVSHLTKSEYMNGFFNKGF